MLGPDATVPPVNKDHAGSGYSCPASELKIMLGPDATVLPVEEKIVLGLWHHCPLSEMEKEQVFGA